MIEMGEMYIGISFFSLVQSPQRFLQRQRREMILQQEVHERRMKRIQEQIEKWLLTQNSNKILIEAN